MDRIYRVEGRVVNADGSPASEVLVALVDDDLLFDDLLGIGVTGVDGAFRVSLTPTAFRQEPLEIELTPDLYAVLSVNLDGALAPIHVAGLQGTRLGDESANLGAIALPARETWRALEKVESAPGWRKSAKRLDIDDTIVAHALAEIGPIVERLTGWSGIVDKTRVRCVATAADAWGPVIRGSGGKELGWIERKAIDVLYGIGGVAGLYDPYERTVYLVEAVLMRQNLDGMKVMLGHELVHAGQFQNHPELVDRYTAYVKSLAAANEADDKTTEGKPAQPAADEDFFDPKLGPEAKRAYLEAAGFMTNLEGYAYYIENDFLRKTYVLASPLPHLSLGGRMLLRLLRPEGTPKGGGTMSDKASEYDVGRRAYQKRQTGDTPVPFDPTFDPTKAET